MIRAAWKVEGWIIEGPYALGLLEIGNFDYVISHSMTEVVIVGGASCWLSDWMGDRGLASFHPRGLIYLDEKA